MVAGMLKRLTACLEQRLTFRPQKELEVPPPERVETLPIPTRDGITLDCWILDHPEAELEVAFFHGNRGNLGTWFPLLDMIRSRRCRVTAIDYRGYGRSNGTPTERGFFEDTRAFLEIFWSKLHRNDMPVIYWGRSLGGVAAAYSCREHEPEGLILEATFASKQHLVRHFPLLQWLSRFSTYELPVAALLTKRKCPVLVVHATGDHVVPFRAGIELYDLLNPPKAFFQMEGAKHGKLHENEPDRYWQRIRAFFQEVIHARGSDHH